MILPHCKFALLSTGFWDFHEFLFLCLGDPLIWVSVCHPRAECMGKEHRAPPAPAAGASLFLASPCSCLPQACHIVCEVLGPGTVPSPALRRSTQRVSHSIDWTKMPRLSWLTLKEVMDRHQCKNSSNNLKNNMITPESREHTTGWCEHPNPEEVEEIDIKRNIMKVIESHKQDVEKLSLRNGWEE